MKNEPVMINGHHATAEGEAALRYAQLSKEYMMRDFRKVAQEIGKRINRGKIIELGSGIGYIAIETVLQLPDCKVTGLESSQTMLQYAIESSHKEGVSERIDFVAWNTINLPYNEATFDFGVSNWSLHHWRNPVAVLNELYRVLKPGSAALIIDIRRDASPAEIEAATSHAPDFLSAGLRKSLHEYYIAAEAQKIAAQTMFDQWRVIIDGIHIQMDLRKAPG